MIDLLVELLSPSRCAACDARVPLRTAFCAPCAATLVAATEAGAAFEYGGAIARAVQRMKYGDRPDLARPLGAALARVRVRGDIDGVVPVPLHAKRLAERGFNQAALLARAAFPTAPLRADLLTRCRDTPRQAELDLAARRENVRGAFRSADAGGRWLLVDDVRTTGATLRACTQALEDAGAARVDWAVLAVAI